jgi:TonB family protein
MISLMGLIKVTVTLALALTGTWIGRKSRAALRHALLAAAFGVILLLPIVSAFAPPLRILMPAKAQQTEVKAALVRNAGGVTAMVSQPVRFSTIDLLFTGWIAGVVLFLIPMATGLWQLRGLRRAGLPWRGGQLPVDRRVEVLLHSSLAGPITCGVWRPAILLPSDAQTWNAADLNRALVHELEHVHRGDWLTHCAARAICALYWFHPLVWMAWTRLELEAERAYDDAVLRQSEATAYADQLVALARRLSATSKTAQLAMANGADLAARVGAVLDSGQRRGRAGAAAVALAGLSAALFVGAISPLKVGAEPQNADIVTMGTLRTSGKLVIVDVVVKDDSGKSIDGLNASDFAITEDGVTQPIGIFEFQELRNVRGTQNSASNYYILGYYTSNQNMDGKFRRIQVALHNNPTAKIDFRTGYYANPSKGPINIGPAGSGAVDPGIRPPVLIHKYEPEYSEEARKAKYSGSVVLAVVIDSSGQVTNVKVIKSLGLGLDEKAMEAVRRWRFRPGTKDGQPMVVQTQVEVDFRLL